MPSVLFPCDVSHDIAPVLLLHCPGVHLPMKMSNSTILPAGWPLSHRSLAEAVECPKCGKHSIVKRSPNTFNCLNCNFHKELPPVAPTARLVSQPPVQPSRYLGGPHLQSDPERRSLQHGLTSRILSTEPERASLDLLEDVPESDKVQPLVFAAIAVIFGIIFL